MFAISGGTGFSQIFSGLPTPGCDETCRKSLRRSTWDYKIIKSNSLLRKYKGKVPEFDEISDLIASESLPFKSFDVLFKQIMFR